jgi:uncharacterized phage protein (TIGR02218 family)
VQIYTIDRTNLSTKGLLFTGSIATISYDVESSVTFEVKGPSQFARVLTTRKRSPMCETDLFSSLCGLTASSYDVATTVDEMAAGGFNFTVTGSLAQADGYFNQGTVVAPSGSAFVIANWVQSTQTITTYLPCSQILSDGDSITLYPGCDKTMGPNGCSKFSNQLNFQGEPHFFGTAAAAVQVGGGDGRH